jgi:hypothetical protein
MNKMRRNDDATRTNAGIIKKVPDIARDLKNCITTFLN